MIIWKNKIISCSKFCNDVLFTEDLSRNGNVVYDLRNIHDIQLIDVLDSFSDRVFISTVCWSDLDIISSLLEKYKNFYFYIFYEKNDIIEIFQLMNSCDNVLGIIIKNPTEEFMSMINVEKNKSKNKKIILCQNNKDFYQFVDGIILWLFSILKQDNYMEQEELQQFLDDLLQNIKLLEQSVIKTVVDSKTENDLILRELTGYLNSTANEVKQLNNIVSQLANAISLFNNSSIKLDDIENKTIEMPQKFLEFQNKISSFVSTILKKNQENSVIIYQNIQNINKKTDENATEIKNMKEEIENLSNVLKTISDSIKTNQDNTNTLIQKLIEGNLNIAQTKLSNDNENKKTISQSEAEVKKVKIENITKIILAVIGSGGILYIIIDNFIKLFH